VLRLSRASAPWRTARNAGTSAVPATRSGCSGPASTVVGVEPEGQHRPVPPVLVPHLHVGGDERRVLDRDGQLLDG
jgi:hypothetical protein